jgi:hypothetical protein
MVNNMTVAAVALVDLADHLGLIKHLKPSDVASGDVVCQPMLA